MIRAALSSTVFLSLGLAVAVAEETVPVVQTADNQPPSDAVVLFDGQGTNLFLSKTGEPCNWKVEDGVLVSSPNGQHTGHIVSKLHFRDAQIHVEFAVPETDHEGENDGNSGVYIHGHYELQILNSHNNPVRPISTIGAVYGISAPKVNAGRKPGEWQTYDIIFTAPRHSVEGKGVEEKGDEGKIVEPGSITALLNGVLVQHNAQFKEPVSVYHPLRYQKTAYTDKIKESLARTDAGPLFLQDHGNPVRFRNVWVRPLDDKAEMFEPKP